MKVNSMPTIGPQEKWAYLSNPKANQVFDGDKAFHEWYRFVLSFPPHLVRGYFDDFGLKPGQNVLDPFCGTGTTLVEAKGHSLIGIGLEANPLPYFATRVKTSWITDTTALETLAEKIAKKTFRLKKKQRRELPGEKYSLLLKDSLLPDTMHEALCLLTAIEDYRRLDCYNYFRLAFAKTIVYSSSNLRFGPEVGLGKVVEYKPVIEPWLVEVNKMINDLRAIEKSYFYNSNVFNGDARSMETAIAPKSIDAVITSPPYPNEKDYTRTTRLESVLLGFINSKDELRKVKKQLVRSNTRGVYATDEDHLSIQNILQIKKLSKQIEDKRIELKKTSGFEKLYHKVTELYFGGMARHLNSLKPFLKPGARLAYVVGDQASYFQILIPTGQILAEVAEKLGFKVIRIDLFRTRFATATKKELREEVVILEWEGENGKK